MVRPQPRALPNGMASCAPPRESSSGARSVHVGVLIALWMRPVHVCIRPAEDGRYRDRMDAGVKDSLGSRRPSTRLPRLPIRFPTATILVLATALTAIASGVPSYWNDEAATLRLARLPLDELLAFVQHKDAVHAIYGVSMHGWILLAGESEATTRAPSALATGAAAAGLFVLLRELDRPRAAVSAAVVFVLLPRSTFNGVEARSSALVTALVVWAAVLAVRAAQEGRWWRWLALAIVAGAAVAVFLYAALVLPALVVLAVSAHHGARTAIRAVLAVITAGLLASPIALTAAGQGSQVGWLQTQPVNAWTVMVEPFFGSSWWLAALVIVLLAVGGAGAFRGARPLVLAAAAWILVPLVTLLTTTALVAPAFTPRYLSMSSPAVAILVALVLASWSRRISVLVLAALVLAALPAFVGSRLPLGKPGGQDLRGVAHVLSEKAQPGDALLLGDKGTVSLRPRIALAAYPKAFVPLEDIASLSPTPRQGVTPTGCSTRMRCSTGYSTSSACGS